MHDPAATLDSVGKPTQTLHSVENPKLGVEAQADGQQPAVAAGRRGMKFSYPSGSKPLDGYTIKRGIGIGGFGEGLFCAQRSR